jgi:flavin-dependent dehydrogenase
VIWDIAIAGGGPAGLAVAIRAAQGGRKAVLLERSADAPDKACGEGLMPSGLRELEKLGALGRLAPGESREFRGIRYVQEDGSSTEALFRGGNGLGIRRTALARVLRERALESGTEIRRATVLEAHARGDAVEIRTDAGPLEARLLVAADGLHSPLRRAAGLNLERPGERQRFGLRRHFALRPWSDLVEVHWADGVEAYVTPVGPELVNVAFLWGHKEAGFDALLAKFPALREKLGGAATASETRGAGPLLQRVRARHGNRLALAGDAAGYVDAITGQGLSLAFAASALLLAALPGDLSRDLGPALRRYDQSLRASWLRYAIPAHALVALSRNPALRRSVIHTVARVPGAFRALLGIVG